MIKNKLAKARLFMGQLTEGSHLCASCGENRANALSRKKIKTNFVEFDQLLLCGGNHLCESCLALLDDPAMRFKPIVYEKPGVQKVLERTTVLNYLKWPLDSNFVLSLPYTFKKHHWLYAGISNNNTAYIGTDSKTVILDYKAYDIPGAIEIIKHMLLYGISRAEIISGNYSTFSFEKHKTLLREIEEVLSPLRHSGAVELFVKYSPAVGKKLQVKKEGEIMLTVTEIQAITILKNIAVASEYRKEDGLRFWESYYKRRINRFRDLPLKEFVSQLCASVQTNVAVDLSIINALSEEEETLIMQEIKKKADLLISLAYSEMKEKRSNN